MFKELLAKKGVKKVLALASFISVGFTAALAGYSQKDQYAHQVVAFVRPHLGDELIAQAEKVYFEVQDNSDRFKSGLFGHKEVDVFKNTESETVSLPQLTPPNWSEMALNEPAKELIISEPEPLVAVAVAP